MSEPVVFMPLEVVSTGYRRIGLDLANSVNARGIEEYKYRRLDCVCGICGKFYGISFRSGDLCTGRSCIQEQKKTEGVREDSMKG